MRTRRLSASAITVVVLSVLLIMAVTIGSTLAWFASQDSATGSFILGEPVVVSVTEADGTDTETLTMLIASDNLLPGMRVNPDIAVSLQPSTTATILRARIDSSVTGGTGDNETLNQNFRDVLTPIIAGAWVLNVDDGWYYFLGDAGLDARVMNTPTEDSVLTTPEFGSTNADYDTALTAPRNFGDPAEDTVLASVVSGTVIKTIPFLTTAFRLPTTITNEYATAQINVLFHVEALQDFIVIEDANVLPTLGYAKTIMDSISTYAPVE